MMCILPKETLLSEKDKFKSRVKNRFFKKTHVFFCLRKLRVKG